MRRPALAALALATATLGGLPLASAQPSRKATEAPADAAAQPRPGRSISLPDMLAAAIRQSPELAQATIDVDAARAAVIAASGIQDWLLSATATYRRTREGAVAGELSTSRLDQRGLEIGISKLLPTGGTISLGAAATRSEQLLQFIGEATESRKWNADATIGLEQPLLAGFGPTATYGLRTQAEHRERAAVLQRRATMQTLIRDLIGAYWEVAYAQADLEIRRSSLDLARERRRLTEASVRLGQVAPTEVVAVDQIIAQRETEILAAELTIAQRSLELRRLVGLEITPREIELSPSEPLAVDPTPPAVDAVLTRAIETSPELAAIAAAGEGAKVELAVAANGALPRLDLSLAYGPVGTSNTFGGAVESMANFDGHTISGALAFRHALQNRTAEGREATARADVARVAVDDRTMRLELALAAVQAVRLADTAAKRIALSQSLIELSEKNVTAETGRFELGKSTNFDVLARQEELKQARLSRVRAVVDYLQTVATIEALSGEILGKYGIKTP